MGPRERTLETKVDVQRSGTRCLALLRFRFCSVLISLLVFSSGNAQDPVTSIQFQDVSNASGLDFLHSDGGSGQQYLYELMSAGMATLDFDRDGWLDGYLLNGQNLQEPQPKLGNGLFRNLRELNFQRVDALAGANDRGYGLGVAAADYNNDGFPDLYVSNFGRNCLLRNNGDGTFSDVTEFAGVGGDGQFGAGVLFLDFDNDQDLDIYCANYVDFTFERHAEVAPRAYPFPPGPKDFAPLPDTLFRNEGDGTYVDWSAESGLNSVAGPSMGAIAGDFDMDGDTDVFVCSDGAPNHLYRNTEGRFEEDGVLSGVAYDQAGMANGSMGVDAADLNQDGVVDLVVTDYAGQTPMLFMSNLGGFFADESVRRQAGKTVLPHVNWGTAWGDFELDGDQDLLILNGHFLRDPEAIGTRTSFRVANSLLQQEPRVRFLDVSQEVGPGFLEAESSRACAVEDLDNDGDLDAMILNCTARVQLLENTSQRSGSWLKVNLVGTLSNRDAVGAKVKVASGQREWFAEVRSGRGYQSHFGTQLHFGFGADNPDSMEVQWPSGAVQTVDLRGKENSLLTLLEPYSVTDGNPRSQ